MPSEMRCEAHPDVETNLRCGKCGRPICPKCMVQTPVGARCPDCAKVRRLPTYQVSVRGYMIATGVGLGIAIPGGIAWAFIWSHIHFLMLSLLIAAGIGYAIGELISLSVNRKRGPGLQAIGGISVVASYAVYYLFVPRLDFYTLIGVVIGILIAVARLR